MMRWTGLAPWEFEIPFTGSLTSAFLVPNTMLSTAWVGGSREDFNRAERMATTETRKNKREKGGPKRGGVDVYLVN